MDRPVHKYGCVSNASKPENCQGCERGLCVCGHPVFGLRVQGQWRWVHCGLDTDGRDDGQCAEIVLPGAKFYGLAEAKRVE